MLPSGRAYEVCASEMEEMFMKNYFVVGHPVNHSLSPKIHALFAAQFDLKIIYETTDFEPGRFTECMAELRRESDPAGLNITVPFKLDAADYCTDVSERAKLAGAVNTISFDEDGIHGDNTDGVGFMTDVTVRFGQPLRGSRVLIAGAGGAACGLLAVLKDEGCASITVANRTIDKALAMQARFGVKAMTFADTAEGGFDVVINATSASLSGAAPAIPCSAFNQCALAYDLFYAKDATPFMRLASESGAKKVVDGLGMLVEQAAESFRIWHGLSPETDTVYSACR